MASQKSEFCIPTDLPSYASNVGSLIYIGNGKPLYVPPRFHTWSQNSVRNPSKDASIRNFRVPRCSRQRSTVYALGAVGPDRRRMPGRLDFRPVPSPRIISPRRYRHDRMNYIHPKETSIQPSRCPFPTSGKVNMMCGRMLVPPNQHAGTTGTKLLSHTDRVYGVESSSHRRRNNYLQGQRINFKEQIQLERASCVHRS